MLNSYLKTTLYFICMVFVIIIFCLLILFISSINLIYKLINNIIFLVLGWTIAAVDKFIIFNLLFFYS